MNDDRVKLHSSNEGKLLVSLQGDWLLETGRPEPQSVCDKITADKCHIISFDTNQLENWDSCILTYLLAIKDYTQTLGITFDPNGLPDGIRELVDLARAVPPHKQDKEKEDRGSLLVRIGDDTLALFKSAHQLFAFVGEASFPLARFILRKSKFRASDLGLFLQETGAYAVPIVSLISFLVGVILAFVGIMQLELFGAQVYVADLVGIAMVRVMGAVMTGIIMAGRTGAAFAAQIGTMQVNEEIDALQTLAISPVDLLVLPRLIALILMMPLLTLFADLMGVVGGAVIASGFYDVNAIVYFNRVIEAVGLNDLFVGLFMGFVFGILIALCGCLRGLQCGRDASAVGDATTSAVVTSIVAIIIATALIIIMCAALGI